MKQKIKQIIEKLRQKIKQILKLGLIYFFPLLVVGIHLSRQTIFIEQNWIFYLLGFCLLFYIHFTYRHSKDKKIENFI